MATEKHKGTDVRLGGTKGKLVRFSHLHVFRPHLNTQSNKQEFSVQIWVPKENVEDKAALDAAYAEQLAAYKRLYGAPGPEFHNPIVDGDTRVDGKGRPAKVPGMWVVSAKTDATRRDKGTGELVPNTPPGVVGIVRDAAGVPLPLREDQIKSGDWGRVTITLNCFDKGKGGVGSYLNNLQKVRDGEPLANRRSAAADFADFDDEDDEDPLA